METILLTNSKQNFDKDSDMASNKRKWLLIEDNREKAECLMANIAHYFPREDIYWFYTEKETYIYPRFLYEPKEAGLVCFRTVYKKVDGKPKNIRKKINFYWCKNRTTFFDFFDQINDHNGIILLDVSMPVFDNKPFLTDDLNKKIKDFLFGEDPRLCRPLITIISGVANNLPVKIGIGSEDEKRILTSDAAFIPGTLTKDCEKTINSSHQLWQILYENSQINLEEFLDKMAQMDQHECHNWKNEVPSELVKYKQRNRWNEDWDMPIQLGYLIQLLNYDPVEFVDKFKLKNEAGYFQDGCNICECLKVMGTQAKPGKSNSKGTLSFSLLGTLFICWAAYRQTIAQEDRKHDDLFIEAILACPGKPAARYALISPPQTSFSLRKTITALYNMMLLLYKSSLPNDYGKDLLKEVLFDETGLSIRLNINPEKLFEKMKLEYERRYLGGQHNGGGLSTTKILDFYAVSNYCDFLQRNRIPFLGTYYGLKILPAGIYNENGIILKFGHETQNHNH